MDALIIVPGGDDELSQVIGENRTEIQNSRVLTEVIQPTALCQLGCDYCGQEHRPGELATRRQEQLIRRVDQKMRSQQYDLLRIKWFGAEPLLGMGPIRSLTPRLQQLAADHGSRYRAEMVTNGLALNKQRADELVNRLAVAKFEITLDGPASEHDRRRPTKSGKGTFSRIFNNILRLAEMPRSDVEVSIRCNVDIRNASGAPELIQLLADNRLQKRISLYFAPIHNWSNDADRLSLDAQEYADFEVELFALMISMGFHPPLIPPRKPIVCMAVNPHSELVDPYGEVFNCTEVSLVPSYGNPNTYSMGSLSEARESRPAARLASFNDDVEDGAFDCARCPMLPVCGGACPKQWVEGRRPCPSAKVNMPERLGLLLALDSTNAF